MRMRKYVEGNQQCGQWFQIYQGRYERGEGTRNEYNIILPVKNNK